MTLSPSRFLLLGVLLGAMTGFADDGARHEEGSSEETAPDHRSAHSSFSLGDYVLQIIARSKNGAYKNLPPATKPKDLAQGAPSDGPQSEPRPQPKKMADHSPSPQLPDFARYPESDPVTGESYEANRPEWWNDYVQTEDYKNFEGWKDKATWEKPVEVGQGILARARESVLNYAADQGKGLAGARPAQLKNRSYGKCYRHVKYILKSSGCVTQNSLPGGQAKNAGSELQAQGFERLNVSSPYAAPQGSVIVYQCGQHGHIEWKGPDGFYSDYSSQRALSCSQFSVYRKASPQCTGQAAVAAL